MAEADREKFRLNSTGNQVNEFAITLDLHAGDQFQVIQTGTGVDRKFYIAALALPVAGFLVFQVIPIVFMILIAFTNYGGDIVPPKLVDWIGIGNFTKILALSDIKNTFFKILGWNT